MDVDTSIDYFSKAKYAAMSPVAELSKRYIQYWGCQFVSMHIMKA